MQEHSESELDIERFIEIARQSANGESYQSIARNENYRIGVIAMIQPDGSLAFSIEMLLRIFKSSSAVDPLSLEKAAEILRVLMQKEYSIAHEDDCWLCCRRQIQSENIIEECELIQHIVKQCYGDSNKG